VKEKTGEVEVLDHVTIGVTDLARARAFYDAALAPLGLAYMCGEGDTFAGYGDGERAFFWIGLRVAPQTGVHIAFAAADHTTVDRFHAAALAAGGEDHGAPGPRPQYHADYYGAFVLDPDGHNIEAVCQRPAPR
jgi:catechol 2,3-dioxygenase-like lactoylglutathione lyase family enzyme